MRGSEIESNDNWTFYFVNRIVDTDSRVGFCSSGRKIVDVFFLNRSKQR